MNLTSEPHSVRRELRITQTFDALLRREGDRLGRSVSEIVRTSLGEFFNKPPHERARSLDGSPDIAEIERMILG